MEDLEQFCEEKFKKFDQGSKPTTNQIKFLLQLINLLLGKNCYHDPFSNKSTKYMKLQLR